MIDRQCAAEDGTLPKIKRDPVSNAVIICGEDDNDQYSDVIRSILQTLSEQDAEIRRLRRTVAKIMQRTPENDK